MGKILISWEANFNDYIFEHPKNERRVYKGINTSGTHAAFYNEAFEYQRHFLLSSSANQENAPVSFNELVDFLNRSETQVIPKFLNIDDVLSIEEISKKIKNLIEYILGSFPTDEIELFISPGTPSMQVAWYVAALSIRKNLNSKIKLFQVRKPSQRKAGQKIREYIDLVQSEYTNNLIILEHARSKEAEQSRGKKLFRTKAVKKLYEKAKLIATTQGDISTLITGASGSGKEDLALYIHQLSDRNKMPFRAINCAAYKNDELLESRLFGHVKGSFTGALDMKGEFHFADKGTLFLDEIGDMSLAMQQTLLRVLQSKEITRIGEKNSRKIDVRIICATHKDLSALVNKGKFRLDLYYRLIVAQLELPSFNSYAPTEKKEAFAFFLNKWAKEFTKPLLKLSSNAEKILITHPFSGNIRELDNLFQNLYVFCNGTVSEDELPNHINNPIIKKDSLFLKDVEARHIQKVLQMYPNNKSLVCRVLGIKNADTLNKKIKMYGLTK